MKKRQEKIKYKTKQNKGNKLTLMMKMVFYGSIKTKKTLKLDQIFVNVFHLTSGINMN